jgi:hypothetical protein
MPGNIRAFIIVGSVSKARVVDSKKVPEPTEFLMACQSRNNRMLIGFTNPWPRDRGVQETRAEMVREMEFFGVGFSFRGIAFLAVSHRAVGEAPVF